MKVHIFKSEHVYNLALLEFLSKNFDLSDQLFIFQCKSSGRKMPLNPGQVYYLPGFRNLWKVKKLITSCEKVYFHLLPMGPVIFFWYFSRSLFKKAFWIFWGADVYEYRLRYRSIKHYLYHLARKKIIRMIPDIAGYLEGDFELLRKAYQVRARFHHIGYPIPTNFDLCDRIKGQSAEPDKKKLTILVGNSGNKTNRHIEAFRILARFSPERISVICPLSYGSKRKSYVRKVIRTGNAIFGNSFIPLLEFLPPGEYLELLNSTDIAVMNHNRQQGLGNILTLLYLGKKVFLHPETTSYGHFINREIKVYDISTIDKITLEDISMVNSADLKKTKEKLREEFSAENYRRNWARLLQL